MHKSEDYGKILFKQKFKQNVSMTKNFALQISKQLPFDLQTIEFALQELIDEGVLILDGETLLQKRMVKDGEISVKRSEAAKSGGGNPNLFKQNPKHQFKQNPKQNPEYENENENENEVENVNENGSEKLILQFDEFRKAYPGVKRGLQTELKTIKKHKDWKTIIPQLEQSLKSQHFAREENRKKGNFVPDWKHLQTYINQRSWEEEIIINQNTNNNGKTGNNSRGGTGAGFDLKKAFAYIDEMYERREAGSDGNSTGGEDFFDC